MKRKIIAGIAVGLLGALICMSGGCAKQGRQGTADNEVLTLTEVPEDKLMITMHMADGMDYESMERGIEKQFPDIDIVIRSNTSVDQSVEHHDTEDIVLMTGGNYRETDLESNFIDLSAESYVQNYYISSLQENEVDGKLYYLPGPSNIYGIVYNKDMFREHGWTVPENLDEFIELCMEIEKTGIRAIQPALYYKDALRQFFTGFTYQAVLGGGENEKWLSDYRKGASVMKGHMEPALDIMDRLLEAGVLRIEDFDVHPGMRSDMMYVEQSCAMILETQTAVLYAEQRAGDNAPELGLLPFFSGSDKDCDYFLSVPVYNMAASKRLEESGSEEKLAAVKEIFTYLSTKEGQEAVIGDNSSVISSIKGIRYEDSDFLKDARGTIEKGHIIPQPYFIGASNTEVDQVLREDMRMYLAGRIDRTQLMNDVDQARNQVMQNEKKTDAVTIGSARGTFTILQTACLLGEVFRERTDAQIGLCMANTRTSGNNWKIYQGDIQYGRDDTLDYYLNLSFQHAEDKNGNEGRLVKVLMTGENILKAMNNPYLQSSNFPDTYFTASGLQITFAPWAGKGNRYVSVRLADGTELKPDTLYTVAFWNGVVNPELIESMEEEYEDTAADMFQLWLEKHGEGIKPENKDFVLDWKTTEHSETD